MENKEELQRRLGYLKEAEKYALASPVKHHQILELVSDFMRVVYKLKGDHKENLALAKKVIEGYTGKPESPFALSYPRSLNTLFIHAGIPPKEAVIYLQGLAEKHPVKEIKFLSLVNIGLMYIYIGDNLKAEEILKRIKETYPDLWQEEIDAINLERAIRGKSIYSIPRWQTPPRNGNGYNCLDCHLWFLCCRECDVVTVYEIRCLRPCYNGMCSGSGGGICPPHPCFGVCGGDNCACRTGYCFYR
jgi:tetratricopeptide (TPR) repeat protein